MTWHAFRIQTSPSRRLYAADQTSILMKRSARGYFVYVCPFLMTWHAFRIQTSPSRRLYAEHRTSMLMLIRRSAGLCRLFVHFKWHAKETDFNARLRGIRLHFNADRYGSRLTFSHTNADPDLGPASRNYCGSATLLPCSLEARGYFIYLSVSNDMICRVGSVLVRIQTSPPRRLYAKDQTSVFNKKKHAVISFICPFLMTWHAFRIKTSPSRRLYAENQTSMLMLVRSARGYVVYFCPFQMTYAEETDFNAGLRIGADPDFSFRTNADPDLGPG